MLLFYFGEFFTYTHYSLVLIIFLPMEGVTVSDIFNLIVTCFETIRLILAGIFNVLHNNFEMKEYLTYTCENLIWKQT